VDIHEGRHVRDVTREIGVSRPQEAAMNANPHQPQPEQVYRRWAGVLAWILLGVPPIVLSAGYFWVGPSIVPMAICLFLLFLLLCPPLALWAWCLTRAPRLTKSVTLLGVLGIVVFGLLVCWALQSRDQARRIQGGNHMRELGERMLEERQFYPGNSPRQWPVEKAD
jgi:hypothetical protein